MLWNLLKQRLDTTQVQTLQKIIELLKAQEMEASPLVIAVDLEWLSWEQSESVLQALSASEKKEEILQQEKFLGHMGVASGFVTADEVAVALKQVDPDSNTLLWKVLENNNIVQSSDFMAVCKARKALCKQILKEATLDLEKKMASGKDSEIPTTQVMQESHTTMQATKATKQRFHQDVFDDEEDLSDLDQFENLDATLSEMALTLVTEEEEEIVDVQVEEAYFVAGKYKRFKEWRRSNYGEKLLKKLEAP